MHILALDTTTRDGSIAVARGGTLLHEGAGDPALTHGQRLPGDMMRALDAAGVRVTDLGLLAVAVGPGSFTGLRVGISAVQGLAVARALRVVPVPTLEALVRAAPAVAGGGTWRAPWMDAQRGEVFAALYDSAGAEVAPAAAAAPEAILASWRVPLDARILFIGDAGARYRSLIHEQLGSRAEIINPQMLAGTIARIAAAEPHRAVPPHDIVPVYVRRPDAELARERRKGRA